MSISSSIRRLNLCSLSRLAKMSETLSVEIGKLNARIRELESECELLAKDESTVILNKSHGEYQLGFDRFEEEIDDLTRKVDELDDKLKTIEEVRLTKDLEEKQKSKLGGSGILKVKNTTIFVLILLVLSLLAMETYHIGAPGVNGLVDLRVQDGKITEAIIVNPGADYQAVEIFVEGKGWNKSAFLVADIKDGKLNKVNIALTGEGYDQNITAKVVPTFKKEILWAFWITDTICCLLFLWNFFFELRLAESKKWYWKRHWVDFLTSIPLPPLHLLVEATDGINAIRAGRILRVLRFLRTVRIVRMFLYFWRGLDHLSTVMDVKLLKRSMFYGLLAMFFGALLFMSIERVQGGDGSFLESLWWSFTTLVTGGFADIHNPQTIGGKILTVMLVIGGMVLVGVFTATLTTVLVRDDDNWQRQDLDELNARLQKLEEILLETTSKIEKIDSSSDSSQK
jgi:voltage-gated potassium channel